MERVSITERPDWREKATEYGFNFHAQAQMAHERAAQGHLEGKIVLSVMDSSAG